MRRTPLLPTAHLRKLSEKDKKEMIRLRQLGWPVSHIAREYNITSPAANYWLKAVTLFTAKEVLKEAA